MQVFIVSVSGFFSFFVFTAQTHTHGVRKCVTVWARTGVSLNHPADIVQKRYCVHVCVCVWCKTMTISGLRSLPLGSSLSTVIHRALTSEDRDSSATGCPSLQLMNHDYFLCEQFLWNYKVLRTTAFFTFSHFFTISARLEHLVFLFIASQYDQFVKNLSDMECITLLASYVC